MTLLQILGWGFAYIVVMGVIGSLIGKRLKRLVDQYYPEVEE